MLDVYSADMAEEEYEDVEDTEPAPREDPAPTIIAVKDQEMVQRDILFQNPFLKCHITQLILNYVCHK